MNLTYSLFSSRRDAIYDNTTEYNGFRMVNRKIKKNIISLGRNSRYTILYAHFVRYSPDVKRPQWPRLIFILNVVCSSKFNFTWLFYYTVLLKNNWSQQTSFSSVIHSTRVQNDVAVTTVHIVYYVGKTSAMAFNLSLEGETVWNIIRPTLFPVQCFRPNFVISFMLYNVRYCYFYIYVI